MPPHPRTLLPLPHTLLLPPSPLVLVLLLVLVALVLVLVLALALQQLRSTALASLWSRLAQMLRQ